MIQQSTGKLIVFEGGDGAGKGTQSGLLKKYFGDNRIPYVYVDFPDYNSTYGKIIARFLRGEFGTLQEISPYFVGALFALDRSLLKHAILEHLSQGKIVLANRYVTSNIAHQGSKCANEHELTKFIQWIEHFEYEILGLPKENLVIYLHVPWGLALELTKGKEKRDYLHGKTVDIQEKDSEHRHATEKMYQHLASHNNHWTTIECARNGTIQSKEEIHQQIVGILQKKGYIK